MADATGFEIDGRVYEIPSLGTFTMDEAQILYERSGLAVEDFLLEDDDAEIAAKLRGPAVQRALMEVAWLRGNPDAKPSEARDLIGAANYLSGLADMVRSRRQEAPEVPLDGTSTPKSRSQSENDTRSGSSGLASTNGSAERDAIPAATGTIRSDTSSAAVETLSAA